MYGCGTRCQSAKLPDCVCSCGGSQHGAMHRIFWASLDIDDSKLTSEELVIKNKYYLRKTESEKSYITYIENKTPKNSITNKEISLLLEYIKTYILVPMISRDQSQLSLLIEISKQAPSLVSEYDIRNIKKKDDEESKQRLVEIKKITLRMADHFWCDFFSSLSKLISMIRELLRAAISESIEAVNAEFKNLIDPPSGFIDTHLNSLLKSIRDQRNNIHESTLKETETTIKSRHQLDIESNSIEKFDSISLNLLEFILTKTIEYKLSITQIHFIVRVLGVLFCPNPIKHKSVLKHCLRPLLEDLKDEFHPEINDRIEFTKDFIHNI